MWIKIVFFYPSLSIVKSYRTDVARAALQIVSLLMCYEYVKLKVSKVVDLEKK